MFLNCLDVWGFMQSVENSKVSTFPPLISTLFVLHKKALIFKTSILKAFHRVCTSFETLLQLSVVSSAIVCYELCNCCFSKNVDFNGILSVFCTSFESLLQLFMVSFA